MSVSVIGKLRLPVGVATVFVVGTDLFVVSPLLPLIAGDLRVGMAGAALAIPAFSAAYLLASPAMGRLAEHRGHRQILLAGMIGFAAANMLTGLAPALWVLLVARMVAGGSAAAITPSLYALTGGLAPRGRRGTWLAILGSGLLSALAVGAPLGSFAAETSGWRPVFLLLAGLTLALLVPQRLIWPPRLQDMSADMAPRLPVSLLRRVRAVSVTAFWGAAIYGCYTYLAPQLRIGFPAGAVAGILVIYGIGAMTGSIVGGYLADRLGARRAVTASLIAVAGCQAALAIGWPRTPVVIAGLALLALTGYVAFPGHQAQLVASYPEQGGSMLAWNNSALYTGILAGSGLADLIHSTVGFRGVLGFCLGMALIGAAASQGWPRRGAGPDRPGRSAARIEELSVFTDFTDTDSRPADQYRATHITMPGEITTWARPLQPLRSERAVDHATDFAAIRCVIADVEQGFNDKDAGLLVRHFARNASVVAASGVRTDSRDALLQTACVDLAGPSAEQRVRYELTEVQFVRPDVAVARQQAQPVDKAGNPIAVGHTMTSVYVLSREGSRWEIVARQDTLVPQA